MKIRMELMMQLIKMLEEEKNAIMKDPNLALKDSTLVLRKKMQHLASIRKKRRRTCRHVANGNLRDKKKGLSFELVATKFGMPIERAADELQVHKFTLQKWCRIHGVADWPYRKIQRIKKLISMVQASRHGELSRRDDAVGIIQKLEEEIKKSRKILEIPFKAAPWH